MNTPDLNLARPSCAYLRRATTYFYRYRSTAWGLSSTTGATVIRLEDDEPHRRIRITVRFHSLDKTATNEVKPGELVHRLADVNDPHDLVYVAAAAFGSGSVPLSTIPTATARSGSWKLCADPIRRTDTKFLPWDGQQRRPICVEITGGMFCDWN